MKQKETKPPARRTEETIVCRSCAAAFPADSPQCPYCGTMNLPAAETAYMNKLEGLRGDLSALNEQTRREMRSNIRAVKKRLLIVGALLAVLFLGGFLLQAAHERQDRAHDKEEIIWQLENYARLDQLYESGDYESLAALYEQSLREGHEVYNYQHARFCECFWLILRAEAQIELLDSGEIPPVDLLYTELQLYKIDNERLQVTDAERAFLVEKRAPVFEDMFRRFSISKEEAAAFRSQIINNGFLSYDELQSFVEGKGM